MTLHTLRRPAAKLKAFILRGSQYVKLLAASQYDLVRYCKHALIGWNGYKPTDKHLEAQIIKLYHVVEKGLAMPEFRPRFGPQRLRQLVVFLNQFLLAGGSPANRHFNAALECLTKYRTKHEQLGISVNDIIMEDTIASLARSNQTSPANYSAEDVVKVSPDDFFAHSNSLFSVFAASRRSWRIFDPNRGVPLAVINQAVEIAINTPSVCNRQSWRVHCFQQRDDIDRLLVHQNGNSGFGHLIPCLLIVTVDLQCFDGVIERYQPWIDGGMFSMTLLFALHHLRLGAIPLNWSVLPAQDRALRGAAKIPLTESIIMLIGAGDVAGPAVIPVSHRRDLNEVLCVHN